MPAAVRIANAPVSFGAFELTAAKSPGVPTAARVLTAIAAAGYEGTELGPPGYLGDHDTLRDRLAHHGLELVGGYVPIRFGESSGDELAPLEETLAFFDAAGGSPRAVLADDVERDTPLDWTRFAAAVMRAAERARERGYAPTFHHHMGTRIQTPEEIERLLELTDVPLLLDSGHLLAAGGDPIAGLRDWRDRIDYLHIKDVDLNVLHSTPSWHDAWVGGAFCELGTGDVDLTAFLAELQDYSGWIVVEQDWVPRPGNDDPEAQIDAQTRNRDWLRTHASL